MTAGPIFPSRIGLGCYPLGGGYGRITDRQAEATIDAAIAHGWYFFDTAETYLDSEERLGNLLGKRRDEVFLATKAFPCEPYTARNLRAALESSLRRLRTDHVDLYQLHGPENWVVDFPPTPLEEIAEGLAQLRDEGKLRFVGICNYPVNQVRALDDLVDLFSMQDVLNIFDAGSELDQPNLPAVSPKLAYALDHPVHFIAYSPLARGLLSDSQDRNRVFAVDDERHHMPRYQRGVYEHFVDVADALSAWAKERGHSLRELAVAWCLHNPAVTSVLVGAKAPDQIAQVAGALDWQLSADDISFVSTTVQTLHDVAAEAFVTVWDHFSDEGVVRLRNRRYAAVAADSKSVPHQPRAFGQ